jgi:hypothetical protein
VPSVQEYLHQNVHDVLARPQHHTGIVTAARCQHPHLFKTQCPTTKSPTRAMERRSVFREQYQTLLWKGIAPLLCLPVTSVRAQGPARTRLQKSGAPPNTSDCIAYFSITPVWATCPACAVLTHVSGKCGFLLAPEPGVFVSRALKAYWILSPSLRA